MVWKWHNLLIFSQFTGFLKYVKEILEEKKLSYNYLDWQTRISERKRLVDSFNTGDVNVFIISLKAWGTWLNLTSADYVIHLDPWWNPAVENQATDRAHRMWQKKTVFVHKLIVKDSIEEKILSLQEKKKKLIDDVFSGNFSGNLSESDINYIFE
jgi:SNF2 family DNA or RNA helicase